MKSKLSGCVETEMETLAGQKVFWLEEMNGNTAEQSESEIYIQSPLHREKLCRKYFNLKKFQKKILGCILDHAGCTPVVQPCNYFIQIRLLYKTDCCLKTSKHTS